MFIFTSFACAMCICLGFSTMSAQTIYREKGPMYKKYKVSLYERHVQVCKYVKEHVLSHASM